MTEWEVCKCSRAFNTVHEKSPSVRSPPPSPTLTLVQTLTQIQGAGFAGEQSSVRQFHGGQFSDHGGDFTEGNFPVKI